MVNFHRSEVRPQFSVLILTSGGDSVRAIQEVASHLVKLGILSEVIVTINFNPGGAEAVVRKLTHDDTVLRISSSSLSTLE
eukprot:g11392.t1